MQQLSRVEIEKMTQLADFLETVPPEDFDLTIWRTREFIAPIRVWPITFRAGCGFAGCAMGWAAHEGLFPGLRITKNGDLVYRGATDFDAVSKLFGIKWGTGWFLFGRGSYHGRIDPDRVAKRIRRFVEIVRRRRGDRVALRVVA